MLFSEVKHNFEYNREPFASTFYSDSLFYFNEEMNYFFKLNDEFNSLIQESIMYEDILMLNEGCKDYISGIVKYLKDTMKYVEMMWNKFSMEHNLAKKETARLVGKGLSYIDTTSRVSFSGYRYTISDENIHIDRYLTQSESQIRQQLMRGIDELKNKADNEEYYNRLRGQFVNMQSATAEEFQKLLHRKYRNGRFKPEDIVIDENVKNEMIDALFEVDTNLSNCIHLKQSIIMYIKSLISYFSKLEAMADSQSEKIRRDHEMRTFKLTDLEELAQIETIISRKIIHIYILVLAAKIDAINERQRVYSKVIRQLVKDAEERGDDDDE